MTDLGELIVKEAREWVNTPWHHNQCCKGVGVDCARFYQGIIRNALGLDVPMDNYPRQTIGNTLLNQVRGYDFLQERVIPSVHQEGDLLIFLIGSYPRHVGISTGQGMIHADHTKGQVIEIPDLGSWRLRLCAAFEVCP